MRWVQWLAYVVALLLRLWTAAHYSAPLQERVELSSPLTSFKRLQEGLFLEAQKPGSAYAGWAFHQPPVVLGIFQQLHSLPPYVYHLIWLLADALAALLLFSIVRHVLRDEATRTHSVEPQRVTADVVSVVPHVAAICYLLHPYSWLSSAALSLTMIENVFVLGSLHFALQDNRVLAPLCIAIAAYTSLYPVMLVPAVLMTLKPGNRLNGVLIFAFFAYALGLASYLVVGPGDWRWLRSVYLYVLKVEDLTPNIGLFWYYFLETFTHYRNFFLVALQLHTFSYVIPCTLRLREQPVLLFWVLLSVITLFKPYPVAGDVLLQLSLLPVFYHLLFYMKANFILLNIHIITSLLFPVLWYMWVESGSGNANFVYSITLVHAIADGWLVAEVVSCGLSWRYTDKHRVPMIPKKQATSSAGEVKKEKTQ